MALPRLPSRLVLDVDELLRELRFPPSRHEHRFAFPRRFAFDRAWPAALVAIEIEGGVHRTRERFESDAEKYFLAVLGGWRVFRVTRGLVDSGKARELLTRVRSDYLG